MIGKVEIRYTVFIESLFFNVDEGLTRTTFISHFLILLNKEHPPNKNVEQNRVALSN